MSRISPVIAQAAQPNPIMRLHRRLVDIIASIGPAAAEWPGLLTGADKQQPDDEEDDVRREPDERPGRAGAEAGDRCQDHHIDGREDDGGRSLQEGRGQERPDLLRLRDGSPVSASATNAIGDGKQRAFVPYAFDNLSAEPARFCPLIRGHTIVIRNGFPFHRYFAGSWRFRLLVGRNSKRTLPQLGIFAGYGVES